MVWQAVLIPNWTFNPNFGTVRHAFGARIVHNVEHLLTRAYAHVEPLPLVTISIGLLGCGLNVGCLFLAQIYG